MENTFQFSVVSAFCGAGGSSLGYKQAGGRMLLAIDNGADAVATYRVNFPDTPVHHGDIADLSVEECCRLAQVRPRELDVLDGSPPCLGYSMLGSRRFNDPRNRLYEEFIRMVRGLRPKTFVLENVSGMVKGAMRVIFVECLKELKASGYKVRARLLNAKYFNVPQDRKRLIFVGVREDLGIEPSHPRARGEPRTVRQALGLVGDGALKSDNQFRNRDPWRSLDQPCPALMKHAPLLVLDGDVRALTPEECGVLSGFPRDFKWGRSAHRLIGNAVPPPFMKAIAEHVRDNVLGVLDSGHHDLSAVHAAPEMPAAGGPEHAPSLGATTVGSAPKRNISKQTLSFSCSKSMQYLRTPPDIWAKLREEFDFSVDVCASHDNHLLPRYYTEAEDGLKQDWANETVYCHPLFDGKIGRWVEKAFHSRCLTVMLLPASTHTRYFHRFIKGNPRCEVRFLEKPNKGFRFGRDDGVPDDLTKTGYIKPLMVVVFRNEDAKIKELLDQPRREEGQPPPCQEERQCPAH